MFERYTEKARRVIFFARYEASQLGSPVIATEHLLLGLVRENPYILVNILKLKDADTLRAQVEGVSKTKDRISTAIDLPLDDPAKRVLKYAEEEANRLAHRHIGPEHLLLGLTREEKCLAAKLLREHNFNPTQFREDLLNPTPALDAAFASHPVRHYATSAPHPPKILEDIRVHGELRNAEFIRRAVKKLREISWHWQKRDWHPRDVVVHRENRTVSFNISLAKTDPDFEVVKHGWTHDYCKICQWELRDSKDAPDHSSGYTNGRDWLCAECYEKFIARDDFFSSSYQDLT